MILVRTSFLTLLLAAACRSMPLTTSRPPITPTSSPELQQNSWKLLGPRDYSFTYQPVCMCRGSGLLYRVAVRDGKVVSFENGSDPVRLSLRDLPRPTVDSLFAWVKDAYARKAAVVRVTYDPQFHFPANVSIDWDLNIIDDEFSFEVRDLRPIPRVGLARR
jgi:Family of unknown function (DUF6174)